MSDCPCNPDLQAPETSSLGRQLDALVLTLFGSTNFSVIGEREVYPSCFTEAELSYTGGILCLLKDRFSAATAANTNSVAIADASCLPQDLFPVGTGSEVTIQAFPGLEQLPGSTEIFLATSPGVWGVGVGFQVVADLVFAPGTVVLEVRPMSVLVSSPALINYAGGAFLFRSPDFSACPTLQSFICWAGAQIASLGPWKTSTEASLQGFVVQQVNAATATYGAAIYNLQQGQQALAAALVANQQAYASLQVAYNALEARMTAAEGAITTLASSTGTSLGTIQSNVDSLGTRVATLEATTLGTPVFPYPGLFWTADNTVSTLHPLVTDGAWHTLDLRTSGSGGAGTGLQDQVTPLKAPKYALITVQGNVNSATDPLSIELRKNSGANPISAASKHFAQTYRMGGSVGSEVSFPNTFLVELDSAVGGICQLDYKFLLPNPYGSPTYRYPRSYIINLIALFY